MIKSAIARTEQLARAVHDGTAATLARDLAQQLPRGELNLLVVGQFKRGKSSLINALLGADVMPTGALPLTGVATAIRYGKDRGVHVFFHHQPNGREVSVDDLPLYVSEQRNPANRLGVERVEVLWPSEVIRGLALFDTPGIGSTYTHNTAAARAALPRADAAILVVGPEPPIGAEELRYAGDVVALSEHLFVVLNKSDIAADALPEILQFTRAAVTQVVAERQAVEVVPLSATRAREAQRTGDEDAAFAAFVSLLRRFVEHQGDATRERSIRRRAATLLQRLNTLLAIRGAALTLPRVERMRRKELLEHALQTVNDRVRSLELMVDDDVARLRIALEEAMDRFHDRDLPHFRSLATELSKVRSGQRRGERLERVLGEHAALWRKDAVELASQRLQSGAAKYARLLGEIETSALEAGCQVLQVDARVLTPHNVEFAPARLELAASLMPTTGLELMIAYAIDLLPTPLRESALKRHYEDVLARELDALRGKLRYGIAHDLEPWRQSARGTIASSIDGVRRAVLSAFSEGSGETDANEEHELRRVDQLQRELLDIKATIEDERLLSAEPATRTSA